MKAIAEAESEGTTGRAPGGWVHVSAPAVTMAIATAPRCPDPRGCQARSRHCAGREIAMRLSIAIISSKARGLILAWRAKVTTMEQLNTPCPRISSAS
jgi:hypothetical protein